MRYASLIAALALIASPLAAALWWDGERGCEAAAERIERHIEDYSFEK